LGDFSPDAFDLGQVFFCCSRPGVYDFRDGPCRHDYSDFYQGFDDLRRIFEISGRSLCDFRQDVCDVVWDLGDSRKGFL